MSVVVTEGVCWGELTVEFLGRNVVKVSVVRLLRPLLLALVIFQSAVVDGACRDQRDVVVFPGNTGGEAKSLESESWSSTLREYQQKLSDGMEGFEESPRGRASKKKSESNKAEKRRLAEAEKKAAIEKVTTLEVYLAISSRDGSKKAIAKSKQLPESRLLPESRAPRPSIEKDRSSQVKVSKKLVDRAPRKQTSENGGRVVKLKNPSDVWGEY